jgi:hypothetical protein
MLASIMMLNPISHIPRQPNRSQRSHIQL